MLVIFIYLYSDNCTNAQELRRTCMRWLSSTSTANTSKAWSRPHAKRGSRCEAAVGKPSLPSSLRENIPCASMIPRYPARVHGIIFVDMVPTPPCRVLCSQQPFQVAAWRGRSVLCVHNAENGGLSRRAARVRERVDHEQASTKTHDAWRPRSVFDVPHLLRQA